MSRFNLDRTAPPSMPQTVLLALLTRTNEIENHKLQNHLFSTVVQGAIQSLSPSDLAELFVFASFLESVGQPLVDQHWIQSHEHPASPGAFQDFLNVALNEELAPLQFLSELLKDPTPADLRLSTAMAQVIVREIVSLVKSWNEREPSRFVFREFTATAMQGMDRLTRFEAEVNRSCLLNSMYRAFDEMDKIFGLAYERDLGMKVDPNNRERLYEGAGVGVQTSYSTVLIALDRVAPPPRARFIDLGSGYGRVGLIIGLLRPDIQFIGYEYVGHRVEIAQRSADHAGLSSHVSFYEQDLSRTDFKIPEAEVYYMYDPFSQETYKHVFGQLKEIGRRIPVTVVTKGRANGWFSETIAGESWEMNEMLDEGTLGVFRSLPRT